MSTKSTIFDTACCHIYKDVRRNDDGTYDYDNYTLCIDVDYGWEDADYSCIEVDWDSDFAFLIRHLISLSTPDELDKLCREHWQKMKGDNK